MQTVDFFPPVVDDPYTYGGIAAANALSDIYAMGAEPLFALNIVAFPGDLPLEILSQILEGGADKTADAGIVVAGGHTVTDDEPKFGLIVTGSIHPDRILTKAGARPGDTLYLTKPLGTGVITTALKQRAAEEEHAQAAVESMLALNRDASKVIRDVGVHACTDITGFGLFGHATEVAIKSGVRIDFDAEAMPWLPGAVRYAAEGRLPGGAGRNRDYYESHPECGINVAEGVETTTVDLLYDPETSGGLLVSVDPDTAPELETTFAARGLSIWKIGRVSEGRGVFLG